MSIEAMKQALASLKIHGAPVPDVHDSITALRTAIEQAEKQEPVCRYPRCSCNSKDFCDPKRQQALDKMAENERALGIQMKPCDCAAKSAADCVCGSWDSLPATPVQEPVGYMDRTKFNLLCGGDSVTTTITSHRAFAYDAPLYTAPPNMATPLAAQRQWVSLTDDDYTALGKAVAVNKYQCRAIEAKLREKNGGNL